MDQSRLRGYKAMNYRSVADLNRDILAWLPELPQDLDLIVGIPRSGLLAANLLALHLNLPFSDVEGFVEGRVLAVGRSRYTGTDPAALLAQKRRVFVVDDTVVTGISMESAKQIVAEANVAHEVLYSAVYVAPESKKRVDIYYEAVPLPRMFEWNLMNNRHLEDSCIDIDGVLCEDPNEQENDDGPRYKEFLENCRPLLLPTRTIGWLVTCRLEKYRYLTEEWLARHGVQYKHLVMMDYPDKAARVAAGAHAQYKAAIYLKSKAMLFIESSLQQGVKIAKLSNRFVLCIETGQMISPTAPMSAYIHGRYRAGKKARKVTRRIAQLYRLVFGA